MRHSKTWGLALLFALALSVTACRNPTEPAGDTLPGTFVFSALDATGQEYQIFSMKLDGSELRQLTYFEGGEGASQPSWSPDGQQIVFSSFKWGTSTGPALWVMNADGSDQHPLYKAPDVPWAMVGENSRWSPDGTKIAYDVCLNCQIATNNQIFVFDITAQEVTRLTGGAFPTLEEGSNLYPVWSPDGSQIAFISNRDYITADTLRNRKDLYIMNADGSNPTRLTETGRPGGYIWMGNDKLILTTTDSNTGFKDVSILNIETGDTDYLMEKLNVKRLFWVIWDPENQQLLTLNKNYEELPLITASYDLNGNVLRRYKLYAKTLKTGLGFDWKPSENWGTQSYD